jgi:hypothetical protein
LLVNNSVTAENAKINKNRTTVTKEEREALTIDDLLMFMEGKAKNEISVLRINDDFTSAGFDTVKYDFISTYPKEEILEFKTEILTSKDVYFRFLKLHSVVEKFKSFIETEICPQIDMYRLSKYVSPDLNVKIREIILDTDEDVINAIDKGLQYIDYSKNNICLFIASDLMEKLRETNTDKSKEILSSFGFVKEVSSERFVSKIINHSNIENQPRYKKAPDAKYLNFLIVEKSVVYQMTKHIILPDAIESKLHNFEYTFQSFNEVKSYKKDSIYVSRKPSD